MNDKMRITEINTPPANYAARYTFSGKVICAETGEEKKFSGVSAAILKRIIGYMILGDIFIVKCDNDRYL